MCRRRHSESEHLGLLPHLDDIVSESDDVCDDSFIITDQLRDYYVLCFSKLLEQTRIIPDLSAALCGQDAKVFEFFLKSNLPKEELGKIWKLADVNEDGFLNLDEFCVAMHLIVRRVKGNLEIPLYLPDCLRPVRTPPRNTTPANSREDVGWVNFEVDANVRSASCVAVPDSPSLKNFTSSLTAEQGSRLACPVACHVSPEIVESREHEQSRLSSSLNDRSAVVMSGAAAVSSSSAKSGASCKNRVFASSFATTSRAKVISPQAPKGPPPKPPPRPVTRHVRSASLDLTKQVHASQPPPTGPAPQLCTDAAPDAARKWMVDTGVQTEAACLEKGVTSAQNESSSSTQAQQQQPMLDFGVDFNDELFNSLSGVAGGDTLRMFSRGSKEEPPTVSKGSPPTREGKDWRRYCQQLTQLNAELEREYKQLMEVRLGLESTLKSIQHS